MKFNVLRDGSKGIFLEKLLETEQRLIGKKNIEINICIGEQDCTSANIGWSKFSSLIKNNYNYKNDFLKLHDIPVGVRNKSKARVTLESWFDGGKFVLPYFICSIDRNFMNRNLSKEIECSGFTMSAKYSKTELYKKTFDKIEESLKKTGYCGPISFDIEFDKSGFYVTNFYAWIRFDIIYGLCHLSDGYVSDFLYSIFAGDNKRHKFKSGVCSSVHLSLPPFPFVDDNCKCNVSLKDFDNNITNYYIDNCENGDLGCICCLAENSKLSINRLYEILKDLHIDELQYRTDLGKKTVQNIGLASRWNWL